jgi:periplasmic mercuric ion binding protein
MKHIINAMLVFGALIIAVPVHSLSAHETEQQASEQTITFAVDGMTCALCPITVRKAMEAVSGVISVETDYDTRTAVVVFDSAQTNVDAIADASANAGYPAAAQNLPD